MSKKLENQIKESIIRLLSPITCAYEKKFINALIQANAYFIDMIYDLKENPNISKQIAIDLIKAMDQIIDEKENKKG